MTDPVEAMYERAIATAPSAVVAERLREYLHRYSTAIKDRPEPVASTPTGECSIRAFEGASVHDAPGVNRCPECRHQPISVQVLGDWLVDKGLADLSAGYGHASGENVAAELLAHFTITPRSDLP